MTRFAWIGALMLGALPAIASADHHGSDRFSVDVGIGLRGGHYDYGRRYDACYAPRSYYSPSYYVPAPVYCPPPAVVYEQPAVVYSAPPAVVYGLPPVGYSTATIVAPQLRYIPSGGYYVGTRYYYGR